jgi:uncharacterized protein YndB with AHSA1/START domain
MEKKAVEHTILIAAPRERVWQAVTNPEELAQWFLPPALGAQMKRNDSGKIFVCMGYMEIPVAIFEAVDSPRQVTIRGFPDKLIAATYTLAEEKGGTRVTVTMSGFESLPEEARQERFGPSSAGWEKALANLKAHVDNTELPFPQGYVAALLGYRREAKEKFAVERSIWIAASRERVWRAITDPEQIEKWYSPGTQWRGTGLEVGGKLSIYNPETNSDMYIQVIEVVDPLHQLVTRSIPESSEIPHVTTWTLAEENGGTRLTLTNSGYELEADDIRQQNMEQNAFGFGMSLENLQAYIEGKSLPYPAGF